MYDYVCVCVSLSPPLRDDDDKAIVVKGVASLMFPIVVKSTLLGTYGEGEGGDFIS